MKDEMIFSLLNKHLKVVQEVYPIENIFGIFVTSIQERDITSEVVIIPSFDKICTSFEPEQGYLLDNRIEIYDIRNVFKATAYGHPELIESLYTKYVIVNPIYQHLFDKLYINKRDEIRAGISSGVPSEDLKNALTKVCRLAWNETSNSVRFVKQLTDVEKTALESIVNIVGDEGVFSQAKAASAAGVSRLTMSNLIMKLKFYNIAIVNYLGNQGTYIKFIDDIALDIRGNKMK